MKTLLTMICAGVLVCVLGAACNDINGHEQGEDDNGRIDIPFTEFSLKEISGRWTNLTSGEVTVINSQDELKAHYDGEILPEIDFSKNTLLLASGNTPTSIESVNVENLQRLSTGKYKLNIEVILTFATRPDAWNIALVVDKLSNKSKIELDVATKP